MGEDAELATRLSDSACASWSVRVRVLPNKDEACTISPHVSTGKNSRARGFRHTRRFGIEDSVRGVRESGSVERARAEARPARGGQSTQSNMNIEAERDRKNTRALDRTEVHDFHASHYGKPMIHFGRIHLFGELNQVKTTATDCRGSSRVVRLTVSRCRELSARDRT